MVTDIRSRCGLMPDIPCPNCGCDRWWWRSTRFGFGWVCGRCHPEPRIEARHSPGLATISDKGLQPLSAVLAKLPYSSCSQVENESPGEKMRAKTKFGSDY